VFDARDILDNEFRDLVPLLKRPIKYIQTTDSV
jgi:hypothetical protein